MRVRVSIIAALTLVVAAITAPSTGQAAAFSRSAVAPPAAVVAVPLKAGYDDGYYPQRCGFKYFWDWHGYKRRKWKCWGGHGHGHYEHRHRHRSRSYEYYDRTTIERYGWRRYRPAHRPRHHEHYPRDRHEHYPRHRHEHSRPYHRDYRGYDGPCRNCGHGY